MKSFNALLSNIGIGTGNEKGEPLLSSRGSTHSTTSNSSKIQASIQNQLSVFRKFSSNHQLNFGFIKNKIGMQKTGVEVDKSDIQNTKAQLDDVLALYNFRLKDSGQGKFELKETDGISGKNWKNKALVCVKHKSSPNIVCLKLKTLCDEPRMGSNPASISPREEQIIEKNKKKDEAQKALMKDARHELKALLEKSGVKLDESWEDIEWNTTRENIEKKIKTSLKASPSNEAHIQEKQIDLLD